MGGKKGRERERTKEVEGKRGKILENLLGELGKSTMIK